MTNSVLDNIRHVKCRSLKQIGAQKMGERLKDKGAVVSGAGRGIGREVALALAAEGAKVVVVDPGVTIRGEGFDMAPANEVVAEIEKRGGKAVANYNSVADFEDARRIINSCVENFGCIDILINCAGVLSPRMVWELSEEDWDAVIAVHLKGTFNCTRWAAAVMREQRSGRIINFASRAWLGNPEHANYSAAKGGIVSFTRSIAQELGRYGITCNCVTPRAATRMTTTEEVKARWKKLVEAGLLTKEEYESRLSIPGPEHIPPIVVYLCTDEAGNINGQVFHAEKGRVGIYSQPEEARQIFNDGEIWSLDRLMDLIPRTLLVGYTNPAPPQPPK